jgi:peptide/nickel transport system substrate-binding protein
MQFPKFYQWKQIFKVLNSSEKKIFAALVALFLVSGLYLTINLYLNVTKIYPTYGGSYAEGVVGQPRFINPIYGETNDVDRTLIDLVYSGLMSYDKDGNLTNDLVESYQISEDGKTYTFELKENLYWQDGVPLTINDIIYTIQTIQNSDYKSPLRANWLDIKITKLSENSFSLALQTPYNSFLENCTVKIIPQHIWENILSENFALSSYNLQPIGSGPYMISNLEQTKTGFIKSIDLKNNPKYYGKKPYIPKISFIFFENKTNLIKAANKKSIDGFSLASFDNDELFAEKEIKQGLLKNDQFSTYSFTLPRYFAVFFNVQDDNIFSDSNLTQALNYSVNKQELVDNIKSSTKANISIVNSPILSEYFGYAEPTISYNYDLEKAKQLLDKSGYKDDGAGQRTKSTQKTAAFQFKSYLSTKSKGTEVSELQKCLAKLDDNFKSLLEEETSGAYGKGTENAVTEFQKKYIPEFPSTGETGPSTRKKLNELCFNSQDNSQILGFTITTINQPQLIKVSELLQSYWQKVGIKIEIKAVELSELKDLIKNRDYDVLLYGEALGSEPDLYPFWHSSQVLDPGLNLSSYQNKDVDQLLKDARETLDNAAKQQTYESLQNKILLDTPALFLYNPDYLYWVSKKINGVETTKIVDPAKRFSNIENWYINTKRVLK